MGRILEALTSPATPSHQPEPDHKGPHYPEAYAAGAPIDGGDSSDANSGEEIPYIEVGPHKSMEASASVLASAPPSGPRLIRSAEQAPTSAPTPSEPALQAEAKPAGRSAPGRSRMAPELLAYHHPEHALSQQYQSLLEPLLSSAITGHPQALLFTAARPDCGTTTVLLNVAIAAARQTHRRVVVVDGNLRRPAVAERLGLTDSGGLREVLAGSLPLERALRETDQVNLFALTTGRIPGPGDRAPGIRIVAETVRSLLRRLRQQFDLVLVDGPRWDGQQDVVLLGTACDAVYLVVAEGEAESSQVDDLYVAIPAQGARLAGCILAG